MNVTYAQMRNAYSWAAIFASAEAVLGTGFLSATEGPDTSAFTAIQSVNLYVQTTEGHDGSSFLGNTGNFGTFSIIEGSDTSAFIGITSQSTLGSFSANEGPDLSFFIGSIQQNTSGTLEATEVADFSFFLGNYAEPWIILNPNRDLVSGSWVPSLGSSIYPLLAKTITTDTTYAYSDRSGGNTPFEIGYPAVTNPNNTNPHVIRAVVKVGSFASRFTFNLYQKDNIVDTWVEEIDANSEVTVVHTLSTETIALITDYSDLRVEITATTI